MFRCQELRSACCSVRVLRAVCFVLCSMECILAMHAAAACISMCCVDCIHIAHAAAACVRMLLAMVGFPQLRFDLFSCCFGLRILRYASSCFARALFCLSLVWVGGAHGDCSSY